MQIENRNPIPLTTEPVRSFSREQIKVVALATAGNVLEFYEFVIFIYFTPTISRLFFPADLPLWVAQLQALAIFAAGYLIRPFGGIILAILGDLVGRKRIFGVTILLMAIPTFAIGLLPTYAHVGILAPLLLLLCRLVQGLSMGGEIPGSLVFVAEHSTERRLGITCALLGTGLSIGGLLASSLVAYVSTMPSADQALYGWRVAFLLGGLFGVGTAYLRRYVHETPVFEEMRKHREHSKEIPLAALWRAHKRETMLCLLLSTVPAAIVAGLFLYSAIYFQSFMGLDKVIVRHALPFLSLGLIIGLPVTGTLTDRFGAARILTVVPLMAIAVTYWVFFTASNSLIWLKFTFLCAGIAFSFMTMIYVVLIRSFPAAVRYTGIAVSYNIAAAVVGGLSPLILGVLAPVVPMVPAHYAVAFSCIAIIVTPLAWRMRKDLHV